MAPEHADAPAPHLDADQCIDLVHGLLPEADRRRLLAHAGSCAACEDLLRVTIAAHERGRARRDALLAAPPRARGSLRAPAIPRVWMAAAALAVAAGAGWWSLRGAPGPTIVPEATTLPPVDWSASTRHRAAEFSEPLVMTGVQAYERGALDSAATILGATASEGPVEAMRRSYLASAQARLGRCADALQTLSRLEEWRLPDPWRDETRWTRLVALERCGHRAGADSMARELARGLGPVAERAARFVAGR